MERSKNRSPLRNLKISEKKTIVVSEVVLQPHSAEPFRCIWVSGLKTNSMKNKGNESVIETKASLRAFLILNTNKIK
jgi:hypothetical protein